jgi:hypothetical protein
MPMDAAESARLPPWSLPTGRPLPQNSKTLTFDSSKPPTRSFWLSGSVAEEILSETLTCNVHFGSRLTGKIQPTALECNAPAKFSQILKMTSEMYFYKLKEFAYRN